MGMEVFGGSIMSGGYFEYSQYRLEDISDDIERAIANNTTPNDFGYSNNFSEDTIDKFKLAMLTLREAAKMAQRVDWLLSGDDGEASFHTRWADDDLPIRNTK